MLIFKGWVWTVGRGWALHVDTDVVLPDLGGVGRLADVIPTQVHVNVV